MFLNQLRSLLFAAAVTLCPAAIACEMGPSYVPTEFPTPNAESRGRATRSVVATSEASGRTESATAQAPAQAATRRPPSTAAQQPPPATVQRPQPTATQQAPPTARPPAEWTSPETDRRVLAAIFNSTDGESWDSTQT